MIEEKPILFSGSMVLAVQALNKTQTRRTTGLKKINENPDNYSFEGFTFEKGILYAIFLHRYTGYSALIRCPYGKPRGNLWIRETFAVAKFHEDYELGVVDEIEEYTGRLPKEKPDGFNTIYASDHYAASTNPKFKGGSCDTPEERGYKWRPSIHIPRWASRTNLDFGDVRVERLNDISEDDAIAEGVLPNCLNAVFENGVWSVPENNGCPNQQTTGCDTCLEEGHFVEWMKYPLSDDHEAPAFGAKESFRSLWESINGQGSWKKNDWLWVVDFKKV